MRFMAGERAGHGFMGRGPGRHGCHGGLGGDDQTGRERMAWDGDEGMGAGFGPGGPGGGPFGRHGRRGGGRFFAQGGLRLVMLALLAEQPRHGYEIIKAIEDRMGGAYVPSAGVVYPTLTLLEETGQIEVAASEGAKKLFAITEAGRATLETNRATVDAMLARMSEAGAARGGARDPRLVRAVENLRLALRLKLASGKLGAEETTALVALLDETVNRIETL